MSDLRTIEVRAEAWIRDNWKKLLTSHAAAAVGGYLLHALLRWPF